MKKRITASLVIMVMLVFGASQVFAGEEATAQDVYDLTMKAYGVVESLGEEALPAFNVPKGEFSYKNTYVAVSICPGKIVGHPAIDKLKEVEMDAKYTWFHLLCEAAAKPNGSWVEYQWPKPGETDLSRKISFSISVKGTPYMLTTGIYSDSQSVDDLNATLK